MKMNIYFSYDTSPYGDYCVASTEKGICALFFVNDKKKTLRLLKESFAKQWPEAHYTEQKEKIHTKVNQYIQHSHKHKTNKTTPLLDMQGSAFQKKVWKALLDIPEGHTVSYSDIARIIGAPHSVRAVASAVARNTIAYCIPCHRVIHKDGTLGNYRWGADKKRLMIETEKSL